MFCSRWLHNLVDLARSRKERRRRALPSRKTVRLVLESLEERLTPSGGNPTVMQTAGSYAALTKAIAEDTYANTNYVLQITQSFQFSSGGQVSISKLGSGSTLTIKGQNDTNYTLTGNGNRLFTVASGQHVTFEDLTLTGGTVTNSTGNAQGGALKDLGGDVTLSKVIVQGNTVKGAAAEGGGVYVSGASTLALRDSLLRDNSAQGVAGVDGTASHGYPSVLNGGAGGWAYGGGLYVGGSGWTVTLIGDTFAGNAALGGNGGNGAPGPNASFNNELGGNGGLGGVGGTAQGGAAFFTDSGDTANTGLTILEDPAAPTTHPSLFIDNTAQAGGGGIGGDGGASTGTANNSLGGTGGQAGDAEGGAIVVTGHYPVPPPQGPSGPGDYSFPFTVAIGNTTFYGNTISSNHGGLGGAPGSGGSGQPGAPGVNGSGGQALGGGVYLTADNPTTVVNCTIANNTANAPSPGYLSGAWGGGIYASGGVTLDNNTITQNTLNGANLKGSGILADSSFYGAANLVNNVIQGNRTFGSSAFDLDTDGYAPFSASNNFIGTMSPNAVNTKTNIVGNPQVQLGAVVGVDANGKPSGGPIYYPLLPGVVSIGAGSTSVLPTIAAVEGTTPANATDEIGNLFANNGAIDLGAVQVPSSPPLSPSPPPPPPTLSPFQLLVAITIDIDALTFQNSLPALSFLNAISEQWLGQRLPATADLVPAIEGDITALVSILIAAV